MDGRLKECAGLDKDGFCKENCGKQCKDCSPPNFADTCGDECKKNGCLEKCSEWGMCMGKPDKPPKDMEMMDKEDQKMMDGRLKECAGLDKDGFCKENCGKQCKDCSPP